MTKFAKALKKFIKELNKKHPHVSRSFTCDVKKIPIDAFVNACNHDIEGFIQKSNSAVIEQNPFSTPALELSILLSEDVPASVQTMVWTYLQSMYVYAFYDTHSKSEVETFLQRYGKNEVPSYISTEWANVAKVYKSVYGKKDAELLTSTEAAQQMAVAAKKGNSSIHSIATDIALDLQNDAQFTEMIKNGEGENLMNSMMKGENTDMLQQLFSTVTTKINQKMENEGLDENAIMQEATTMFANMQNNPAMTSMVKAMMQSDLTK